MPTNNLNYTTLNATRYTPSADQEFFYTIDHTVGANGALIVTGADGITGSYRRYYWADEMIGSSVDCLQYNGRYFYTSQRNISGSTWISTTIKKWESTTLGGVDTFHYVSGRTYTNIKSLAFALESYHIQPISYDDNGTYTLSSEDSFIMSRLNVGDQVLIKPTTGSTGVVYTIDDLDLITTKITFNSIPNSGGYSDDDILLIDVSLWIFDGYNTTGAGAKVYEKSVDFVDISEHISVYFSKVSSADFSIIGGEYRINSGNRTPCLCFKSYHTVFITTPDAPTSLLAQPILPYNYYSNWCTPIPSQALIIKTNYSDYGLPRCLSYQNSERDPSTLKWYYLNGYNVVEFKLSPYLAFMNTVMDKWTLVSGEKTNCRCHIRDQYDFGLAGRNVHWSTDDSWGEFLGWDGPDLNDTETDSNGIAYNEYQAGWLLPGDITRNSNLRYTQMRYEITTEAIIT